MKIMDQKEFDAQNVFGLGQANTAYAQYFIGDSFLNPLTRPQDGLFLANVTFEHRAAATTGTSTMRPRAAGRCSSARPARLVVSGRQSARGLAPGKVIVIPVT